METLVEINKLYNDAYLDSYEDAVFYHFLAVAFATKKAGGKGKELDALDVAIYDALVSATFDVETQEKAKAEFFFDAVEIWLTVADKRTVGYDNYFAAAASVLGVCRWKVYRRKDFVVKKHSVAMRLARKKFYDFVESVKSNPDGLDGVRRDYEKR